MYGIINLFKEKGITSFKQINMLKKIFPDVKIGHTGTLDPIADGVLIVCIGKATRLADYIQAQKKIYKAEMILGLSTDSYDITGKVLNCVASDNVANHEIEIAINSFIGKQSQRPPIFSAKKVNGMKLYEYAMKEKPVEIRESYIEIIYITSIQIDNTSYNGIPMKKLSFEVECSKGTYIRSLCHDIGEQLKKGGTMSALTRMKVGNFKIADSYTISEIIKLKSEGIIENIFIPIENAINLPFIRLNSQDKRKYINGVKFESRIYAGDYIIKDMNDEVIGIGSVDENCILKGKVMLNEDY